MVGCSEESGPDGNSSAGPETVSSTLSDIGLHVLSLSATNPLKIDEASISLDASLFSPLTLPNKANLNDISITGTAIKNNTPYNISELILNKGGKLFLVSFPQSLIKYTQGQIGNLWADSKVVNFTVLSNSTFEYLSTSPPVDPADSKLANLDERNTGEHVQIYDRFMMNSPSTLSEITEHLRSICADNSECDNYGEPLDKYASDTYFAKSVSGLNTRFWINNNVWGLGSLPALNFTSSESEN